MNASLSQDIKYENRVKVCTSVLNLNGETSECASLVSDDPDYSLRRWLEIQVAYLASRLANKIWRYIASRGKL